MNLQYAELDILTNFSFHHAASHPEEYVNRAYDLGYYALGTADINSMAGVVRGYSKSLHTDIKYVVGSRFLLNMNEDFFCEIIVYPYSRLGYGNMCELLSCLRQTKKDIEFCIDWSLFYQYFSEWICIVNPCTKLFTFNRKYREELFQRLLILRGICRNKLQISIGFKRLYSYYENQYRYLIDECSRLCKIPKVVIGGVKYHIQERGLLYDVVLAIKYKTCVQNLGYKREPHSEYYLKNVTDIHHYFKTHKEALERTIELSDAISNFSLSQLHYEYPLPAIGRKTKDIHQCLRSLVHKGLRKRFPHGIPNKVYRLVEEELALIKELRYERYFLACYEIVCFAKSRHILCQGRGAAANSCVCFALGITAVDPSKVDLLFARFVSKERNEPPDIDIDFEHERREEVIQFIYSRYGRKYSGLVSNVVTYRKRGAIRAVGKALGLSENVTHTLAKSCHRWTSNEIPDDKLKEAGIEPESKLHKKLLFFTESIIGFPRHLSQHSGGFILSEQPLDRIVPIVSSGMKERTIVEWNKDDIEVLGILKIDVLALGMLTCIRKAFSIIKAKEAIDLRLYNLPAEDPNVFDMICNAETLGVFQIESRAQMSMLPRLRPRTYYDLVIEIAIVRPGPIHGEMVHPYLRRRAGKEIPYYADKRVEEILGKTLGVPLFQEQAMRLSIELAGFSPGEAEQLRRAMASWRSDVDTVEKYKRKIIDGMVANGYSLLFADNCLRQLRGFSEYGFPESHAASFAHLVYASSYIKCYYPAAFVVALLNSQPMGFYAPSQIITDARKNSVSIQEIDILRSDWETIVIDSSTTGPVRLGFHLVKGLKESQATLIVNARTRRKGNTISDIWNALWNYYYHYRTQKVLSKPEVRTLNLLAKAGALKSIEPKYRNALWEIHALSSPPFPFDVSIKTRQIEFPFLTKKQEMFYSYEMTGLSLNSHPMNFIRTILRKSNFVTKQDIMQGKVREGEQIKVAGLALCKQRPGTAKGMVFITLEDEFGMMNVVIPPQIFEKYSTLIMLKNIIGVKGKLEKSYPVVYLKATALRELDSLLYYDSNDRPNGNSHSY